VEDTWIDQIRLVASSPRRVARLLMNGASRTAAPIPPTMEQRPLLTPRSLEAAEQSAAAMKLTSHAVLEEGGVAADTILAVHAAPEAEPSQTKDVQQAASKTRSLIFRPMKKAAKMATGKKQALIEVDVPFELPSQDTLAPTSNALVPM